MGHLSQRFLDFGFGLFNHWTGYYTCRSHYYKSCKKCDINVKEYRNAGLLQNKSTRVAKYLIPVIIVSVLLNILKFLETSVAYDEETGVVIIFTLASLFITY